MDYLEEAEPTFELNEQSGSSMGGDCLYEIVDCLKKAESTFELNKVCGFCLCKGDDSLEEAELTFQMRKVGSFAVKFACKKILKALTLLTDGIVWSPLRRKIYNVTASPPKP